MKPTEAFFKCKRQVIDHITARIEKLEHEAQEGYGTSEYFLLKERVDELSSLRSYIHNYKMVESDWDIVV